MAVRFDLESVAPSDRAEIITDLSRQLNGRIEVDLPSNPAHLRAVTTSSVLGQIEVSAIQWNLAALRRTVGPTTDDVEPYVFVGLQESGTSCYVQGGREAEIRPGDLVLLENARPYTVAFRGNVKTATVRVPTEALGLPASVLSQITAVRLGPDRPVADAAAAFFSRLIRNQDAVDEAEAGLFAQPSIELIRAVATACFGHDDLARDPLQHTLVQRVLTYLRLHLAERDLTPARIAAAHHISVRQLYLILSQAGISLGDWIKTQRLEECRRELASPTHRFLTIEAIAHRWAFPSAPHFSRAFKSTYGVTPREWRNSNN